MSDAPKPVLHTRIDDRYTTITTDAIRVWFTVGDAPDDTASVAVSIRSVGTKSKVQRGMHAHISKVVREAVEKALQSPTIALWTEKTTPEIPESPHAH